MKVLMKQPLQVKIRVLKSEPILTFGCIINLVYPPPSLNFKFRILLSMEEEGGLLLLLLLLPAAASGALRLKAII